MLEYNRNSQLGCRRYMTINRTLVQHTKHIDGTIRKRNHPNAEEYRRIQAE